jgi:hypothetical protein
MDSGEIGFLFVIVVVFIIGIVMMVFGFGEKNQSAIRKDKEDFIADAVAEGIRRHEEEKKSEESGS